MTHVLHPGDVVCVDRGVPVLAQDVGGDGYRRFAWTVGPGAPEVRQMRG